MITFIKKIFQIRTYFPKGLSGRFLIMLLFPIIFSQLFTSYIFYKKHWKAITNKNAVSFVGNVLTIVDLKKQYPDFAEVQKIAKKNFSMNVKFLEGINLLERKNSKYIVKFSLKYVYKILDQNLKQKYVLFANEKNNDLKINIQYPDGILTIDTSLIAVFSKTFYLVFIWIFGSALIALLFTIPFFDKQLQSIKKLTFAIDAVSKGGNLDNFKPSGAKQVKEAGKSFIKTYNKLQGLLNSRTKMLTNISKDLKTPLNNMKASLEFCTDKDVKFALSDNIDNMTKMIDSYLDFTEKIDNEKQKFSNITFKIKHIIQKINKGVFNIKLNAKKDYFAMIRPFAFEKALTNIIMNAIQFGNKTILITVTKQNDYIKIIVEDNGKGISKEMLSEVLKPFVKIDNKKNNGIGLGLPVANEIIQQDGGDLTLESSKNLGGLKVEIKLPV